LDHEFHVIARRSIDLRCHLIRLKRELPLDLIVNQLIRTYRLFISVLSSRSVLHTEYIFLHLAVPALRDELDKHLDDVYRDDHVHEDSEMELKLDEAEVEGTSRGEALLEKRDREEGIECYQEVEDNVFDDEAFLILARVLVILTIREIDNRLLKQLHRELHDE